MDEWNDAQVMRYVANKNAAIGTPERTPGHIHARHEMNEQAKAKRGANPHALFDGSEFELVEEQRRLFEADAEPYGFDLTRSSPGQNLGGEPWSEYSDAATGHRWGGWLARACLATPNVELTGEPHSGESSERSVRVDSRVVPRRHRKDKDMKTPLTFGEGSDREWYIRDADENWVAEAVPNGPGEAEEAARRITACVNVCDGLDTALLEKIVALGTTLPRRLEAMTNWERCEAEKQRDELADAIRLTLEENGHLADGEVCTLKRLKDALAKVGADRTAPKGHNADVTGLAPRKDEK